MSWLDHFNGKTQGNNLDTGVVSVVVAGDRQLNAAQVGHISKQFAAHKAGLSNSLAGFHVANYVLPDGTRMRVKSNSGIHRVEVMPEDPSAPEFLPHGLAVKSNWTSTRIYARSTVPTVSWSWDRYVPQVERDTQGYEQILRPDISMVLPLVLNVTEKLGWDWWLHQGYTATLDPGDWIVPMNLIVQDEDYQAHRAHVALNDTIQKLDGTELYAVEPSDEILLVDPEEQVALPGTSDSSGEQCALQHYRVAELSPTNDIWQFRFCNEVLERTAEETYTAQERNVVDIVTPLDETTATDTNINDTDLGEDIQLIVDPDGTIQSGLFGVYSTYQLFVSGCSVGDAATGFTIYPVTLDEGGNVTEGGDAARELVEQSSGSYDDTEKLVAVGGDAAIEHVRLRNRLNYVRDVLWRMGTFSKGYDPAVVNTAGNDRWGTHRYEKLRRDMHYWIDGSPEVLLDLGWNTTYKLLEGTTTGRMDGHNYSDTEWRYGSFASAAGRAFITNGFYLDPDGIDPTICEFLAASQNLRNSPIENEYIIPFDTGSTSIERAEVTSEEDERPTNSGSYDLTSRHVIDYDHRGRFIAAIKVRVVCSGATWVENTGVHNGYMEEGDQPTYAVTISMETDWNGTIGETVLFTISGVTRAAYEFVTLMKANPYYYPPTLADGAAGRDDFFVRIPPVITPSDEAMKMLPNLAKHQGVNPHIACQDIREDMTEDQAEEMDSTSGIESSVMDTAGVELRHFKRVTGQLYARTFNLAADIPEALWLLHATKVSARQNDGVSGDQYFYFDGLKAALETTYHVEVRDGVHVQWSDTLGSDDDRPAATERELELYQV